MERGVVVGGGETLIVEEVEVVAEPYEGSDIGRVAKAVGREGHGGD